MKPLISPTPALAQPADIGTIATTTTRCGCPIWLYDPSKSGGKQRYSGVPDDWTGAIRRTGEAPEARAPIQRVTVEKAIDLYLVDRSKKAKDANRAPDEHRYILRDRSKRQQSLQPMAEQEKISYLDPITARHLHS
jgi:hypothetical protein